MSPASPLRRLSRRARNRWDRRLVTLGDAAAARLHPATPVTLRLDYSPTADGRPRYGFGRPVHAELSSLFESGIPAYREVLEDFRQFIEPLASICVEENESSEPCWVNRWLIGLDTVSLYAFTRIRRPRNYVEIGSGESTKVVARARRDGGLETRITSIDPAPRSSVDSLCDVSIRSHLEVVDLDVAFPSLTEGDIVFFDGSHRVLPNSDCVAFFLDVLPALPPGVLVGIHDIYLPLDYPDGFFQMWWSEQYILAAMLLSGCPWFEVTLPSMYVSGRDDVAAPLADLWSRPGLEKVNRRGSSFWITTKRHDADSGA